MNVIYRDIILNVRYRLIDEPPVCSARPIEEDCDVSKSQLESLYRYSQVRMLTLRLLMSYIYIYIYIWSS